ncbi:alpha/beta hydrolase [Falsibacillus pallidus]|uniref:Phospholipase/carboxylesterase n=1 Tax=Falsibacillus pallidus TaxID=493781 RepID=A0A370GVG3_9BACI|nr:alpha/beta hydrolase [Falsibacillus pallidus]RDI45903.1 phospholipase/carboxylesterase [Falsibacillus pallidus]
MKHLFKQGTNPDAPVLLLLHGTGGTEHDLLTIGSMISEGSSILSVRGNVSENGMPRFFRRLSEGVFDEEDLIFRTKELNEFLDESSKTYAFDRKNVIAVGYSNGANIAGSLHFHFKDALKGSILFHPMVPRRGIELPDLKGTPIFIGAGTNDPLIPAAETEELAKFLTDAGANVKTHWEQQGHQLTGGEVQAAKEWLRSL